MSLPRMSTGIVIVGAGPAGLAPLFAAACAGKLRDVLARGVTILERGDQLGCGALHGYAIGSDSTAESFLDILNHSTEPSLRALHWHPLAQKLASLGKAAAPLALVARFLALAGGVLCDLVAASERGSVLRRAEVIRVTRTTSGRWRTRFRQAETNIDLEIDSVAVVLALGASQPAERLSTESVAGQSLSPRFSNKLMQSGEFLANNGLQLAAERLRGLVRPRVVIVGGSTSAGATAARLLHPACPVHFGPDDVVLMHRKPLRIFYDSVSDALTDGYAEFRAEDVCALTGRVYRFSGFRLDSRELVMAVRGIGNRPPEDRLNLFQLTSGREAEAQKKLGEADLIVAALGYRPNRPPLYSEDGQQISVANPRAPLWSTVDASCRLQTDYGASLPNLYSIGLAVGPAPTPDSGGEQNFHGQVNSLWMWQHVLGLRIAERLIQAVPLSQTALESIPLVARQKLLAEFAKITPVPSQGAPASATVGELR